jgi:predicted HicB family RNase H-like nuclease
MTKKSFKDSNPALQFISTVTQEEEAPAHNKQNTYNTPNTPNIKSTKAKEETKSKRLNLLLQPSVVADMEKIAAMKRSSVNDLINTVLKDFILQEADTLVRYEEVFGGSEK